MSRSEEILKNGSFGKLLINLSLPSVVIIIIMIIYNVADTYFIGQTGDPHKIAAISLSMPVFTILSGIGTLFGNGGTTAISIALGEGNKEKIKKITTFCFLGCLSVGILFFLIIFIFTEPLAILLGADDTTLSLTITYLKTFSFACPLVLFSTSFGSILRADGDGKAAVIPNIIGTISNIILDALFILLFQWDVFGAAFATVLGNAFACVVLVFIIVKKKPDLIPEPKKFTFAADISIPVLTLGLPMTLSTVIGSVSSAVQNRMMISYGANALAAQSVAGKISMIITMMILGFCMGMQPAISYNFGGKNYKRMYQIIKQTGIFTIVLGLVLTVITFIYKDALVAAFIDNRDVITMGQTFVIAAVIVGPVYGIYQLSQTFMQATGKVTYAIFSSMLDKFLVYLPVLFIMNYKFGVYGIAFAHAATMIFTLLITLYLALKWSREIRENHIVKKLENLGCV